MNHDAEFSAAVRRTPGADSHAAMPGAPVVFAASCPAGESVEGALSAPANSALARLCEALDAAFLSAAHAGEPSHSAEFARRVRAALAQAVADETLLAPAQREGSPDCYRRHLLAADPRGRYAIAALVWQPGQASPVHAHHTWCGYAVIDGALTETVYDWNEAAGCATESRTHPREAGAASYTRAGTTGIHRLCNTSTAPAVSLHLYGVAGPQITTHVNDLVRVEAGAML
ncbi:cysteine dioxygenase [Trinickia terrae]|uniref:Cysteine dioxygenase n=1 Tax=Trinickia terrae TaxID=2571161 RepID=A0A4U1I0R1_9BURK|nr:cysteine dioxygenase family protein [Trinickia terrae]TKC86719.1 cysteine dioxygenase [Trinickia terrae]